MNYIITVINPESLDLLTTICATQKLPIVTVARGEGTADASIQSLFGITYSLEKRVVLAIADDAATKKLLRAQKRYLDIDAPGHGMTAVLPVKSVGGRSFLAYLNTSMQQTSTDNADAFSPGDADGTPAPDQAVAGSKNNPDPGKDRKESGNRRDTDRRRPVMNQEYELIFCIANNGATDAVMAAARKAGAHGGTVIHAKGTGDRNTPRFYNVTISSEKEIVMILARTNIRTAIMQAILKEAGPTTDAGAIAFSVPVGAVAGIDTHDEEEEEDPKGNAS